MIYTSKPVRVAAIEWTGANFAEVEAFAVEHIGALDEIGLRNEPDEDYNMVQFYAWGDDQEVDPGRVIVVFIDDEDAGEIMSSREFAETYEAEAAR